MPSFAMVGVIPPVAPVARVRVGEIDDDDDDFFDGVAAAAVPLLLRRGVFERDGSGEVVAVEGARIFAREEAVGEVRREVVGEEEDEVRGNDLLCIGGFEFGFGVEDTVSDAGIVGAGERTDRDAVIGRAAAVGPEAEEGGRRPVPVRDAVGEIEEVREHVVCREGCAQVEGDDDPDFWTALREVSGDERREEEGVALPEAGGPVPSGLWDDLLLLSLSAFGRVARGEMDGTGERGRAGLVVVVVVVIVVDGLGAAAAGSGDAASPVGSVSDAEVVGMFGKGFSSAGDTGSGASAASSTVEGSSPSVPSVPSAASVSSTLAGCGSDDSSSPRASSIASAGASCISGNASRAD